MHGQSVHLLPETRAMRYELLASLFAPLGLNWLAFEGDGVVVVDKPAGTASIIGGGRGSGDLVSRLEAVRGETLRCPQPLDAACSGLVAFAQAGKASKALAAAAEGGQLVDSWLALTTGRRAVDGVLEHRVDRSGRGLVAKACRPGTGNAVTRVRVIERGPGGTLVELIVERGRPAQLRAQLAAAGVPIVGDRERGGAAARRLMLHAAVLTLPRSLGGETVRRAEPHELLARLASAQDVPPDSIAELTARLRSAAVRRFGLARGRSPRPEGAAEAAEAEGTPTTTAFRVANAEGDGLPGLALDVYGDYLVAHLYPDRLATTEDEVLDALGGLGAAGVYVKRRRAQSNDLVDTRRDDVAPAAAVRGDSAPDELVVFEEGVPYRTRLGDGLSTGLFLDQRNNRRRVREWARGQAVLNLFAYTCPFTVAAAVGGATRTVSVDAAGPALDTGRANVEHAAGPGAHEFRKGDAFVALDAAKKRGEGFGLVIVDPPTYSTTRGSRWTSGKAWVDLAGRCLGVLEDGGKLLACSNDRRMTQRVFRGHLEAALAADGRRGRVRLYDPPDDFPPPPGEGAHLKTGVIELG